ncbi:MAG: helix-turn-helix domain-containing protein [Pseudomonadales bacterium]
MITEQYTAQNNNFMIAPPEKVERALGQRLEKLRLSKNMNQTTLANEAGVSRRTITRLENGEGVSLDTLIRVMKALGVVDRLETLLPDPTVRPIERVRLKGRERKRAREKSGAGSSNWTWGDEPEKQ